MSDELDELIEELRHGPRRTGEGPEGIELFDIDDLAETMHRAADAIDALRSGTVGELQEPDYYYDPENWEYTCDKTCLDELAESLLDYGGRDGTPARISTLFKGPDKWVVRVPLDTDGDGEPDDWETIWFDNEDDALRALAETKEAGDDDCPKCGGLVYIGDDCCPICSPEANAARALSQREGE